MRRLFDRTAGAFGIAAAANVALCAAIGGLADGTRGIKAGVVVGVVLAVLPLAARATAGWLARPDGMLHFVWTQLSGSAIAVAQRFFDGLGALLSPLARALRFPGLMLRFALMVAADLFGRAASAIGARLFTPLGLGNLAALGVIAANLANVEFATPITILGFGAMLLVLLVDLSETQHAENSTKGEHE